MKQWWETQHCREVMWCGHCGGARPVQAERQELLDKTVRVLWRCQECFFILFEDTKYGIVP